MTCWRALTLTLLLPTCLAGEMRAVEVVPVGTDRTSVRWRDQSMQSERMGRTETMTRKTLSLRHTHYFDWQGRQAFVGGQLSQQRVSHEGGRASAAARGLGDPMLFIGTGWLNLPASTSRRAQPARRTGSCQLQLMVPLGEYDTARALNPGSNRWVAMPECQLAWNRDGWALEAHGGVNWYGDNPQWRGVRLEQRPSYQAKLLASYGSFRSAWGGVSLAYLHGGETSRGGWADDNALANLNLGGTIYVNLPGDYSLRLSAERSVKRAPRTPRVREVSLSLSYTW